MQPLMMGLGLSIAFRRGSRVWPALALVPLLSGCLGLVAVPLIAGGSLAAAKRHHVRAATAVARTKDGKGAVPESNATVTSLQQLPPPTGSASDDPWQRFFAYARAQASGKAAKEGHLQSALLADNPSLDTPVHQGCLAQYPAVVIDLDDNSTAFDPAKLQTAPVAVAQGLAGLRAAGVVVLWISQLPAARATEVASALKSSGLDPQGVDQLLLLRRTDDRKQLLRANANDDVCVVAIAGDTRADFDELFDYLLNPGGAVGLYPMMGKGWFLVPRLDGTVASEK
jgi:hypothetical protein